VKERRLVLFWIFLKEEKREGETHIHSHGCSREHVAAQTRRRIDENSNIFRQCSQREKTDKNSTRKKKFLQPKE
jgi:hypothetical protein